MSTAQPMPTFSTSLRGYDRDEVDRCVAQLTQQLVEARAQAGDDRNFVDGDLSSPVTGVGARIDAILTAAHSHGRDLMAASAEDARSLMTTAHEEALDMVGQARQQAEQLLREATDLAQRRAEEIVASAEAEAIRMAAEARAIVRRESDDAAAAKRRDAARAQRELMRAAAIEEAHRAALDLTRSLANLSSPGMTGPLDHDVAAEAPLADAPVARATAGSRATVAPPPDVPRPSTQRARVTSVPFAHSRAPGSHPVTVAR